MELQVLWNVVYGLLLFLVRLSQYTVKWKTVKAHFFCPYLTFVTTNKGNLTLYTIYYVIHYIKFNTIHYIIYYILYTSNVQIRRYATNLLCLENVSKNYQYQLIRNYPCVAWKIYDIVFIRMFQVHKIKEKKLNGHINPNQKKRKEKDR